MAHRKKGSKLGGHGEGHGGNHERWLLTYADMITLLVAFFIMLYSMSVLNNKKFEAMAVSVRSGFGGELRGAGQGILEGGLGVRAEAPGASPLVTPGRHRLIEELRTLIIDKRLSDKVRLRSEPRGLVITLVTDKVLFQKAQAEIRPETLPLLHDVLKILSKVPNHIRVEGHTCNLPVGRGRYASNWELSTARAVAVIRYAIEKGLIPENRLSAAGYADSRPVAANDSEAHRQLNRRVDIVVVRGVD